MNVLNELKKLELMVKYANEVVKKAGLKDQRARGKLNIDTNAYEYFKQILKTSGIFPDFKGNDGVCFDVRKSLYKRFYEYSNKIHYITLLDAEEDEVTPDFYYYNHKVELDNCNAIIELKKQIRSMIKNPDKHWHSS